MTDWNPEDPFDLGVWSNLGLPPPQPGEKPEGYVPLQLPIPPFLSRDPTKSPEAKRSRKSLKLNKPATLPKITKMMILFKSLYPTQPVIPVDLLAQASHWRVINVDLSPKTLKLILSGQFETLKSGGQITILVIPNRSVLMVYYSQRVQASCHSGCRSMSLVQGRRTVNSTRQNLSICFFAG